MKRTLMLLLCGGLAAQTLAADAELVSIPERYSYAMGVQFGQLLKAQRVEEIDTKAFAAAIDDVLKGGELQLSAEQMQQAVREQQQVFAERRAQQGQANLEAGREFLAANAKREGIVVLPSGLQYQVLESGDGAKATAEDTVRVNYHGTLIDGTVFDSSVERGKPAEFSVNGVIPGFREAITNMRVGDRWQVYLPSSLAYGERGAGGTIGPNETLIFELELLDVVN
jgi:FKBP-type peptidyl-prolyl cis-trans isomerase FklB